MPLARVTANNHTEEVDAHSVTHAACLYIGTVIGNRPPTPVQRPGEGTVFHVEHEGVTHYISYERAWRWAARESLRACEQIEKRLLVV